MDGVKWVEETALFEGVCVAGMEERGGSAGGSRGFRVGGSGGGRREGRASSPPEFIRSSAGNPEKWSVSSVITYMIQRGEEKSADK